MLTQTRFTTGSTNHDAFYGYDTLYRLTRLTDWLDGTNGLRKEGPTEQAAGALSVQANLDALQERNVTDAK